MKKISKKKKIIIGISGLIILVAVGLLLFFIIREKRADKDFEGMNMPPSMEGMGENVISASGLTSVGMSEETLDFGFLETELYVEESFLATGDEVEAGTAVFRVSDETLAEAKKELTNAVTEAQLAYRQGLLDYETDSLQAKTTYETAEVNQKYAQAEYDSAVSMAASKVEELEEQVEEARELVEEYEKSINEDYYRSYYEVDELYNAYYEHFMLLMEKYEEWDIESLEGEYGNSSSGLSGLTSGSSSLSGSGTSSSSASGSGSSLASKMNSSSSMAESIQAVELVARNTKLTAGSSKERFLVLLSNSEGGNGGETDSTPTPTATPSGSGNGDEANPTPTPTATPSDSGNGGERPSGGMPSGNMPSGLTEGNMQDAETGNMQSTGVSEEQQKLNVYNLLDELVKQEHESYETALENYEKAKKQAEAGIDEARSNLTTLEAELTEAQTEYEKELILCKADYDTTIAESENSSTVYNTTCQSLEETLEALLSDKEEAEENLALFEEVLGDGSFYTTKAGTIVLNAVREDSYLSGDTLVIAYSNPETVTIAASVDQSDIAQIAIGDEALVVINEYGNYKGTVTMINPITQASSRSSVTYQVTVTLEGDISGLESNLTAYVYFGVENIDQMSEKMNMPEGGEMPEGMTAPEGGEIPEGMTAPEGGEMPEGMTVPEGGEVPEGMSVPENGDRRMAGEEKGAGNEGTMEER